MRAIVVIAAGLAVGACARAEAIRTSGNTMVVQARAAPACGPDGAARVAVATVAVETLRAGYDRYVINGGQAGSNVQVHQMPGHVQHSGTLTYGRGSGFYSGTSTYVPGPTIVTGGHNQNLAITMFRVGEPGAENAIDAKQILGPEWADKVRNGIGTCL
ncbi:hypothetical protein [Phreatobacter sp.]|uniref:hypothetical protein n=1 Tax=Phreatobacter sp. TaxID=1966341 RepID=UPI0022C4F381|nr:hypothetical protein [Phreatobacter sp.]MCZ8314126.1 hypothetical protein [Phreatobacter sp.]